MPIEFPFLDGEYEIPCTYFREPGEHNTRRTLEIAARFAAKLEIEDVILASHSGESGLAALELMPQVRLVVVTHSTGFVKPDVQQLSPEMRKNLEEKGAVVLTCQHAFGGVNRAVRKKLGTYQLDEIIAFVLRTFGQGTKVAVEMALMAADAGLIPTARPCISIGGTRGGLDTAVLLKPAHAQDFFDLRVMAILAKPLLFES